MKPIRNFEPISKWIIRFAVMAYLISLYFNEIMTFNFTSVSYYISLVYVLSAVLLLLGGVKKAASLTVISGLFISLISIYKIYVAYQLSSSLVSPPFFLFVILAGIGLFFASRGNS